MGVNTPEPQRTFTMPTKITIYHCNGCGRTKLYGFFNHYAWGKPCPGKMEYLTYRKADDDEDNTTPSSTTQLPEHVRAALVEETDEAGVTHWVIR
jgi:hypothetical protein